MSRGRGWFWGALVVGGLAWAAASWTADELAAADDAVNRVWLERLPKSGRDIIGHFVMVDHEGKRFGATGRSSRWRHDVEVFKWALEEDRLVQVFPQTRSKVKSKVVAGRCDAPRPFDMCLELTSQGGSKKFYSRHDWVIEPGETADGWADDHPELAGFLGVACTGCRGLTASSRPPTFAHIDDAT